jgi:hypothetical protein
MCKNFIYVVTLKRHFILLAKIGLYWKRAGTQCYSDRWLWGRKSDPPPLFDRLPLWNLFLPFVFYLTTSHATFSGPSQSWNMSKDRKIKINILYVLYLMHRKVPWLMVDEFEMMWSEEIVTSFKALPSTRYIIILQLENYSQNKTTGQCKNEQLTSWRSI